jgi:hypothetical protein
MTHCGDVDHHAVMSIRFPAEHSSFAAERLSNAAIWE